MIAGVELPAARAVRASENRHIVHHHIPGFEGDILQDVGRGPSVFLIEGVLHGDSAHSDAETLRQRFRNGTPVEFVAPLATAFEVQDVLIRSIELSEVGGWSALIHARITVIEYVEPPKTATLSAPSLTATAEAWGDELDAAMGTEALARRIAADPASASSILEEAGARSPAMRDAVLGKAGGLLAGDPVGISSLLSGGGAPSELLSSIGGALGGNFDGLAEVFNALPKEQLKAFVGHVAAGDLAGALGSASDIFGDGLVGDVLGAVAEDPEMLEGLTAIMRGDLEGLETLARGALGNPAVMSSLLGAVPELLDSMGVEDLAGSIGQGLSDLTGVDVTNIFNAIGDLDPAKVGALLSELSEAGSLAEIAEILADGAGDFMEDLIGIDVFDAGRAMLGAADFLRDIKRVIKSGRDLIDAVRDFDPIGDMRDIFEEIA
ncbi:DNA circularization N-terminal domain-containing protein [Haliangium ochraceum]|nr:DNA circularization N-terminal domain-containing protein [Haliangium ochraceum]